MKRHLLASILMLSVMQVCALPNLIGRWQSAPIWDRFHQTTWEITFIDTVHFEAKVMVDYSYFNDEESTTMSMGGTYQLKDSLCFFTEDTTTFSATSMSISGVDISITEDGGVERYLILPSKKSDDIIALIDDKTYHDVFVFYRQKE